MTTVTLATVNAASFVPPRQPLTRTVSTSRQPPGVPSTDTSALSTRTRFVSPSLPGTNREEYHPLPLWK